LTHKLTTELELGSAKVNKHAKYIDKRTFHREIVVQTHRPHRVLYQDTIVDKKEQQMLDAVT